MFAQAGFARIEALSGLATQMLTLAQLSGVKVAGALCALVVGLTVFVLIGAMVLRAACSLFNKFAGGEDSDGAVPEPDFGQAMKITFVTALLNVAIGIVSPLVLGRAGLPDPFPLLIGLSFAFWISFLVQGVMVAAILPTTLGKGFLIMLLNLVILLAITLSIAALVAAVMLALGMRLG